MPSLSLIPVLVLQEIIGMFFSLKNRPKKVGLDPDRDLPEKPDPEQKVWILLPSPAPPITASRVSQLSYGTEFHLSKLIHWLGYGKKINQSMGCWSSAVSD
jgi:hypothetical protein